MMKISLPRQELTKALNIVRSATTKNGSLPILANVCLRAQGKSLELRATDNDISISTRIPVDVEETGSCTVNAAMLYNLVNSFSGDQPVELIELTHDLKIECGQSRYKLGSMPAKDMPPVPKLDDSREFQLTQHIFHSLLLATAYCQGADEARAMLQGSLVRLNGSLTVAACDGKRLAVESVPLPEGVAGAKADFILPQKAVKELLRLLSTKKPGENETALTVTAGIGKNAAHFQIGETLLSSKLMEGKYPPYENIIPKELGEGIPINRHLLLSTLQRVNFVTDLCTLEFEKQNLTVRGRGKDIPGEAVESLLIPETKSLTVNFNLPFLIEALSAVDDDEVRLYCIGEFKPAVIKVASRQWLSLTAAITPPSKKSEEKPAEKKSESK
ncbi:MAG TPA: DNA polymerase III subunit beta [Verrucomicrobiae bacterium]|nr:DNA polymerase III subunit beta [Verrucomicrobiae bacterium]